MSLVGGFPGIQDPRRRTIRAPTNPMDVTSIISIYPKRIHEVKPTIQPGIFTIEPGTYEKPAILVVGSSSWWREIDEEQPLLEIPNSSIQVADSVVKDWANGLMASNGTDTMPGLFYLMGSLTVDELKKTHKPALDKAQAGQKRWFQALVKMADGLWARTNGNPLVIAEDMRIAARELALTNKDWMKDFSSLQMVRCFACGALRNPEYPVCATCKAIDPTHPSAKDIKFAL